MSDQLIEFNSGNKWFVSALNKLVQYARGHGVNPAGVPGWSWTIDGWMPPRSGLGASLGDFGFKVSPSGDSDVKVSASVVSGMGAWASIPVIAGDPLTMTPAPVLPVGSDQWVCMRIEVVPGAEIIFSNDTEEVWRVAEGSGTLEGDIEVLSFADTDAMELEAVAASVDSSDGAVIANGVYIIPLAFRSDTTGNSWKQIGYTGPLGVRMCASGAFIAMSPARGTLTDTAEP